MATPIVVVLERAGIEPGTDRWFFRIQGDPSQGAGLKCSIGSIAVQEDSSPKAKLWEKTSGTDTGWAAVTPTASTQANKVSMEQFGSFAGGVADHTVDEASLTSAIGALAALGGGRLELFQNYSLSQEMAFIGDNYANIEIVAMRPGAGFTRSSDLASRDGTGLLFFQGATTYGLVGLRLTGVTFSGHSTSDYTQLVKFSDCDGVIVDSCRFLNNASEGLVFEGQNSCRNATVINCYAANVGGGVQKLSAYQIAVDTASIVNCVAINCGQGCEQDGRNFRAIGNHFENCAVYGILALSTWASWLDPFDGVTVHSSANVVISGNTFIGCLGAAIGTGDSTGHTTGGVPVPGNQGQLLITGNTAITCKIFFTGGADTLKQIVIRGNYCEDASSADNYCIIAAKGRFVIEGNTFRLGGTSAWSGIIRCGDQDPVNTSGVIQYNTIVGLCWTSQAMLLGPEVTLGRNLFENITSASPFLYAWAGSDFINDGAFSLWRFGTSGDSWMVLSDPDMVYSNTQPSRIRVKGAPPTKGTWKVGDRAENVLATGVQAWRCVTAGTFDTALSGITCSTTSGSASATVTGNPDRLTKYQWISIAGVTGAKQLTAYDPATGIATLSSAANATVTSGAVGYVAGAWQPAGLAQVTTAVTTTYTVGANDQILYYTASGDYTITLPSAASSEGLAYTFLKTDTGTGTVTIAAAGSDTINGASTYVSPKLQYFAVTIVCTNGSWTYRTNKPTMADLLAGTALGSGYTLPDLTVTGAITNSIARYDAGNSGSAKTLTWTAARRTQKCTLTAATPAITIDDTAIPSGEYLITDFFEDATGSRVPTWALSSTGTINWVGGSAPTLTTTATKADRIIWENEGTRITAWVALANF